MTDSRYKIQYGDRKHFAEWSDWIDAGTPLPEINILSIITEQTMTIEEWNDYAKKYLNHKDIVRSELKSKFKKYYRNKN